MKYEYLGPLGGLIPLRVASTLAPSRGSSVRESLTVEGVRVVQRLPHPLPRTWELDFPHLEFGAGDILEAFATGVYGMGPWVWVPSDAQVGSVLTPAQSAFRNLGSEFSLAGPVVVDGTHLPVSASVNVSTSWKGLVDVPVVPGVPVTASVWVQSTTGAPIISTGWIVGSSIPVTESVTGSTGGMWQRLSWTGIAPAGASQLRLGVRSSVTAVAGPQVTFTPGPVPYAMGRAASSVIVESATSTPSAIQRADQSMTPLANVTATIMEVGHAGW